MPNYEFFCLDCQKFFYKILSAAEYEEVEVNCPYCDGKNIEQRRSSSSFSIARRSA